MQGDYVRYAIYWIPQRGTALAEFGCAWTGWCAEGAHPQPQTKAFARAGTPGALAQHGLHAALAAPFRLKKGHSLWGLERAVEAVAAATRVMRLPMLELTGGDDLMLTLGQRSEQMTTLIARLERALAPMAEGGTHRVGAFRVPLTMPGGTRTADTARAVLEPFLGAILNRRQAVTDLAMMGYPGGGRPWRVLERYALARAEAPETAGPAGMACAGPALIAPLDEADIAV